MNGAVLFAHLPLLGLTIRASTGWVLSMQYCVDLLHAHFAEELEQVVSGDLSSPPICLTSGQGPLRLARHRLKNSYR